MAGIVSPRAVHGSRTVPPDTLEMVSGVSVTPDTPSPEQQAGGEAVRGERELLYAIHDWSGGDPDCLVRPATLTVAGLTREEVYDLTQHLLAQGLLECPYGDAEVCLTPKAIAMLAARSPKKNGKTRKEKDHGSGS